MPNTYSSRRNFRPVSNNRISARARQALVLLGVIVFGMIISAAVNAIPSRKRTVATQIIKTEQVEQAKKN